MSADFPAHNARIGKRLRAMRKDRGLVVADLATRFRDVAPEHIAHRLPKLRDIERSIRGHESGEHAVGPRYRLLYAAAFGMDEETLFGVERRELVFTSRAAGLTLSAPHVAYPTGRRIGLSTIKRLRNRTARLRRLDDLLGGADTYRLYVAELESTTALVDEASYTDATGRTLLGVVAEQAHQAGWAAFDAGWQGLARKRFKEGLTAASDAGDTSLIANSLAFLAYQKVSTGQPGTDEADASCRVADNSEVPQVVQALLRERAAWAHAVAGDARAAEEALDLAYEALSGGQWRPSPDWALWVDQTELQIMTGRCWSTLRNPRRAIPALEGALGRYDDAHARDKALYMTWLADAHIDGGDVDQAVAITGRALDLSADVASVRPRRRIDDVLQRLKPHRVLPAVAELIEEAEWLFRQSPGSPTPDTPPSPQVE